jgi:hypothetical protein
MFSRTRPKSRCAPARKGLIERIAEAIYEASLRRTLRGIRTH